MDESNLDVYFNDSMVQSYNNNATVGVSADASSAMQLTTGYLAANEDVTYSIRVWIDYDVTMDTPNVAGKTWNGRVVVSSEATGLKPSLENKVVTSESVTLDAVVNNGYQVNSITCYYGDEGNLVNEGTAIGTSQCVFPVAAEYAKVCMTYPSGTVECSEDKQLADYFIKDGVMVKEFEVSQSDVILNENDGYLNMVLGSTSESSPRMGIKTKSTYDFTKYYSIYFDSSFTIVSNSNSGSTYEVHIPNNNTNWFDKSCEDSFKLSIGSISNDTLESERTTKSKTLSFNENYEFNNTVLEIGKNVTKALIETNVYNVWFQLAE